jgi:phosphatidylserine/phosphatidylglycerophosphate/cardiolipin synthase-like enzyme
MHHKFIVIDGKTVIVTSANFTTSDIHGDFKSAACRGNPNNLLKLESPKLAKLFAQEFSIMWGDGPGGKPDSKFGVKKPMRPIARVRVGSATVAVQFSPATSKTPWLQTPNGLIDRTHGKRENISQFGAVCVLCPAVGKHAVRKISARSWHPSFG